MKIFNFFALVLTTLLFSCSSDGNTETSTNTNQGTFNIVYDNAPLILSDWKAERDGDYFRITSSKYQSTGSNSSVLTNSFATLFHKDGTLIETSMYDRSIQGDLETSFYYSRNTFEFNIEEIDEINHTLKVNFNGKIYSNPEYVYNSDFKTVSGTISMPYEPISPFDVSFAQRETTMLINNVPWRGKGQTVNQEFNDGTAIQINGDQQYSINIVIPKPTIQLGTFTFSQNEDIFKLNSVNLFKYYPGNISPNEYRCSGSLTITQKSRGMISGTFSLTAYDPLTNETVVITNGVFKEKY